ncbi:hypothetical protein [Alkalilimnicola ehrlichii]|nr:hypothetical protein [Alkalilimnicola ehrlichii]
MVLIAPSAEFVQQLPYGKIPDRKDFYRFTDDERIRYWRAVAKVSERLGEALWELIDSGRISRLAKPL